MRAVERPNAGVEAAGYLEMVQGTVEAAARIDANGPEGLRNRLRIIPHHTCK